LYSIREYKKDLPTVLLQMENDGLIAAEEKEKINATVVSLFQVAQVPDWFSEKWTVKTEAPILLPEGKEARIDRLLIRDRKAIVIDFKTGAVNKKDEEQVREYMKVMKEMNFTEVEGYLLYLRDNSVVEIKSEGRQKLAKKLPPKDQLSLGF
jgi:ATP-dependent helicase/nuclease subunit A